MTTKALQRYAGMSVLIVDDNESNIAVLKALVEDEGLYRVYTETDARCVRDRLMELRPDLVVLDLHMPNLDGHQVLRQIKEFAGGGYLPVLVLTADTTIETRNRALRHGAQDFLTKPFDLVEASLRIANLLETRQLHATLGESGGRQSAVPDVDRDRDSARDRIESVIRDRAITPAYQPIVDVTNMSVVGFEGLSRFTDPRSSAPDRWFAEAFTVGLGVELEWLAATVLTPVIDSLPIEAFLAINMSPATILHMADESLCPPAICPRLVIELTEHVPVEDYSAIHRALDEVRADGARLAADDLGSGYAGFRHLISLKPDIIKLDISLVGGIHRSREQRALASALATFATDIGATVIGEGVEDAEDLQVLRDIGVPWAQGYHLGKPGPYARTAAAN
jgi:EAL domain-containing protein (putative c-di-GMP-specific phosphodiesterase class I)/ActR/RegA family two-component response regulator